MYVSLPYTRPTPHTHSQTHTTTFLVECIGRTCMHAQHASSDPLRAKYRGPTEPPLKKYAARRTRHMYVCRCRPTPVRVRRPQPLSGDREPRTTNNISRDRGRPRSFFLRPAQANRTVVDTGRGNSTGAQFACLSAISYAQVV